MTGSPIREDVRASFQNESLFYIDARTGMSPGAVRAVPVAGVGVAAPAPVSGAWIFDLSTSGVAGTQTTTMRLTLNQYKDAVVGYGDMTTPAGTQQVSAGGTIVGNRLALHVIPMGAQGMYRMSLTYNGPGSISGNYVFSGPTAEQLGVVFGRIGGAATTAMQTPTAVPAQAPQTAAPSY